jgi:8-oxo-dGTP diphosphatase
VSLAVTCALIVEGGRLLVARRADTGRWELPGGKVENGEGLAACLQREIAEELGCRVEVGEPFALAQAPEEGLVLHCFHCRLAEGRPRALEHRELAWVTPAEALELELCPPDRELARRLAGQGVARDT